MNANLLREVEDIHTRTFGRGARTIGVTSPQTKSGVSTLAKSLAKRCALSGQKSLLMDISRGPDNPFIPDHSNLISKVDNRYGSSGPEIWQTQDGYDILAITPTEKDKYRFRDARDLQEMLKSELEAYEQIVVDLSHVPDNETASVPGGVGAAACDAVVLVCRTYAVTRASMEAAVKSLANHNAKIAGLVMNDQNAPTMAHEMLHELGRMQWFLPRGIRNFIEKKITDNKVLNTKL